MSNDACNRLNSANGTLRDFLKRVEALVQGKGNIGPEDLRAIGGLLRWVGPEISRAGQSVSADEDLRTLLREYAANLRATQRALEQVRCVMLARRARMDAEHRRLSQLRGWTSAYQQTI